MHDFGFTWTRPGALALSSHALVAGGRVWLVDPTDDADALERAAALGPPAAVLQLLDRHHRSCLQVASRLEVPLLRVPDAVPDSPFEVLAPVRRPRWRESALWWPEQRVLVVAEAVGTSRHCTGGSGPAGLHPFLRLRPPRALRGFEPDHLLVGHGHPLHGTAAADGLRYAYDRSLRDMPRVLLALPGMLRSAT